MKKRYIIIIVILIVFVIGFITTKTLLMSFEENLQQLALLEISDANLTTAQDGSYKGSYSVFPITAEVKVTIKNNAIEDIELLKHDNGQGKGAEIIIKNVIKEQSLNVDCVSGATYSSKVILKAIQNAIMKAGG